MKKTVILSSGKLYEIDVKPIKSDYKVEAVFISLILLWVSVCVAYLLTGKM